MPPNISPVIVTSRVALDEAVAVAIERTLRHLNVTPREPEPPGVGSLRQQASADTALGVSKPTLARWRKNGTLPFSKVGGSVYVAVADVQALLESRRVR